MGGKRGRSKAAIGRAAADLFSHGGYAATSIRDIAHEADADPALVIRHYGSKEQLFLDTMRVPSDWTLHFDPPRETLGERIVRFVLATDPRVHTIYLALMRASDASDVAAALREAHEHAFVEPLREMLEGPDADLRARLVAAAIGGLLSALWLVGDEYLVTADRQTLITAYAGAIQQLITPNASTESGSSV